MSLEGGAEVGGDQNGEWLGWRGEVRRMGGGVVRGSGEEEAARVLVT